jgi:DNA-binding IclR family transcriptional regulator
MQGAGFATSEGTRVRTYRVGQRLLRLLHTAGDKGWIEIAVQPILSGLADELSETCFLARLQGQDVISLAWAAPSHGLQGYVVPGHVVPAHAAASAKAVLAFQPPDLVNTVLKQPLQKLTPETKVDRKAIEAEYEQVRRLGYATCWNEMVMGLAAVAVPIDLPKIGRMYALAVSGFTDRITERPVEAVVGILKSRAGNLARVLGNDG